MTGTLPTDWTEATLGSLASDEKGALTIGPFGSNLKVSDYVDTGVPLVFVRDIRARSFGGAGTKFVSPQKAAELSGHTVRSGDLLVTKMGDPPGDTAVYPDDRPAAVITADCIKMTVDERASSARFLVHWLRAPLMREAIFEEAQGVAQQKLSLARFREIRVPLPPLDQQCRIVEKIEALTAKSRRAKEALDAIPPLLERFRQSVLAAAFRGDLTKDWREQNPDVESAATMLAREHPLSPKHTRLRKLRKKVKTSFDFVEFPPLPGSWEYSTVDDLYDAGVIIDYADGNHGSLYPRKDEFGAAGIRFVTAQQISAGRVMFDACPRLSDSKARQLRKGWARGGDVLLTHNATVGRVAIVPHDAGEFLLGTSVTFYRLNSAALDHEYFFYCLRGDPWQAQLRAVMAQTTRDQVSIQKQAHFSIPVPPVAEQRAIVLRLTGLFARAQAMEVAVQAAVDRGQTIDQAVLSKAFRGELVDPTPGRSAAVQRSAQQLELIPVRP